MIVSCPNCVTKYNLPDEKVPAGGIKVKCSKCSHLFKVTPPAATPEEEVEVLLDDSNDTDPQQDQSSDFDAAFEEAVAGGGDMDDDDGLGDMDFGDDDSAGDDLGDMDFGDSDAADDISDDDLPDGIGTDDDDDVDDDEDFGLGGDDDDDDDVKAPGGTSLDLGGDSGLFASLDGDEKKKKKKGGLGKLLLTLLLLIVLALVAAVATFNMGLWSLPESMQDAGIELPFDLPVAVPFIKGPGSMADEAGMSEPSGDMGEGQPSELLGDPTDRIKDIQPVEYNQYVINNEVEGRLYVVEGEALNNSATAKKDIKVEVALFAKDGTQMASEQMLCGNTLSLFQIQVDDKATIAENLASSRGINLNNSYIKPGESAPFMFVFFGIEGEVETFRITIVDAYEAQR